MELIHGIDLIPCFFSPQDFTAFVFLNVIATLTSICAYDVFQSGRRTSVF